MRRRYPLSRYLLGAGAARTGDEMSAPALLLTGTALAGSGPPLLAALTASAALGGPVLGTLLDRTPHPGRLLGGALAAYATTLLLVWWSLGTLPLPATLSLALTAGLFAPSLAAGWTSQLPRVTAPEHLPRAGALDAASYEFAALAGPALAGGAALAAGPEAALLTSVALVTCALPAAWSLPGRATGASGERVTRARGIAGEVRDGFAALLRIRPLARATLTSTLSHAGLGAFTAVTPVLGVRAFGAESAGAFLLAALAFASLVASLALARRPDVLGPDAVLLASTLVLGAAFLAAPAAPLAASFLAGLGAGPQLVALFAIRHREAPERLRGQIFSTGASLKISGYAAGAGAAAVCPPGGALPAAAGCQALAAAGFLLLSRTGDRPKTVAGTCG
ncbi:MFS transporter [Streptomyces niveiscabiei]|uniref:MFS transporter n=1 Tax=Streptomyces niveiscabiei TaxID=164115 RepID=UPI0029A410E6|nr:MFS transporter [Streptomyces niveiscabiei]MDX3381903.1 MFS transporter [Streptomyces niveiscabiei]